MHHAEDAQPELSVVPRKARVSVRVWSMAAAVVFAVLVIGSVQMIRQQGQSEAGAMMQTAILAHQQLSQNATPLDISSDSPQALTTWFRSRVSFPFRMANSGIASDLTAKYTLMGGRLVTVNSESLALVAFNTPHGVVTLLVGPERLMKASGGTVVESGGIMLHSHERGALHIVTWNTQGLSYVLTSSRPEGKQQSCASCHEESSPGMKS
jgi:anti-sigma factor RsiW